MLEVRIRKRLPGFTLDVAFNMGDEILTMMGHSGSGKTMTLQCIAGLVRPDEGFIRLNGRVLFDSIAGINLPVSERRVGFVFQNYALFPHLTALENIEYGIRNTPRKVREAKLAELVIKTNCQGLEHRRPHSLSAGEQQRVALARALARDPEILLLDEPFSALDLQKKENLELELLSLAESFKGSMLFVTHDFSQGYKLSSKIAVYDAGRILQCDRRETVVKWPANGAVAKLVGLRNLMGGYVGGLQDTCASVRINGLGRNLWAILKNNAPLAFGQPVTIGVRPESIRVVTQPRENTLLGAVTEMVEDVTTVNCYFQIAAEAGPPLTLMAVLPRSEASLLRDGRSCYLYLPPEEVVVIPAAAETRRVSDVPAPKAVRVAA